MKRINRIAVAVLCVNTLAIANGVRSQAPPQITSTRDLPVTISDSSPAGSPFRASGSVTFHETFSADEVLTQYTVDVSLKNVSSKPVLAFALAFVLSPDYGGSVNWNYNYDGYFNVTGSPYVEAGSDYSVQQTTSRWTRLPYNASAAPQKPQAQVTVLFVEFTDGSKFGGGNFAGRIRSDRNATIDRLNDLMQAYRNGGGVNLAPVMTVDLARPDNPTSTSLILNNVKLIMDQQGAESAATRIQQLLTTAHGHSFTN